MRDLRGGPRDDPDPPARSPDPRDQPGNRVVAVVADRGVAVQLGNHAAGAVQPHLGGLLQHDEGLAGGGGVVVEGRQRAPRQADDGGQGMPDGVVEIGRDGYPGLGLTLGGIGAQVVVAGL